jgi:hypothetical protein
MAKYNVSEADYHLFMTGDNSALDKYSEQMNEADVEKMKEYRDNMLELNNSLFDIQETV